MKVKGLVIIGLSALTLAACGGGKDATSSSVTAAPVESTSSVVAESSSSAVAESTTSEHKVGDTIVFDGEAEITITAAEWTEERNQYASTEAEKVLLVTYNVKNLSDKDYLVASEIELYVDGKKAETYPVSPTIETISPGRSFDGATSAFAVNGSGALELEVKPPFSFTAKPVVVKLDLQ